VTLRPHQIEALDDLASRLAHGVRRTWVDAPTGSGKTVLFCALAAALDGSACVLVPRRNLAEQTVAGFARHFPSVKVHEEGPDAIGQPFGPLLKLLLLTGARLNEVARMTRDELSADGATWSLPRSRTKNARPHVVPLPPAARDLITSVPHIVNKAGYVFTTRGDVPVSSWTYLKNLLDAAMIAVAKQECADAKIPHWRLHDLRRTTVTGMAELGIQPDVIELCVNHISGTRSGVAGVYNRSELLPERKAALERWAAHLASLVEGKPPKIVPLRKGA